MNALVYTCMMLAPMNLHGDPLGLKWLPMLVLYSNIGKNSNSYEKKCEIGSELKKLWGKHDVVVNGINDKLNSLINRGAPNLSNDDMADLKRSIVSALGDAASRPDNQSAGPVVCTSSDRVVFDDEVKQFLAKVVKEQVEQLARPRDGDVPLEHVRTVLSELFSEKAETNASHFEQFSEILKNAQRELSLDHVKTAVSEVLNERERRSRTFSAEDEDDEFQDDFDGTIGEPPDKDFEWELYQKPMSQVIRLFKMSDDTLLLTGENPAEQAVSYSAYRRNFPRDESEHIDRKTVDVLITERTWSFLGTGAKNESAMRLLHSLLDLHLRGHTPPLPKDILRVLHTSLK